MKGLNGMHLALVLMGIAGALVIVRSAAQLFRLPPAGDDTETEL